MRVLTFFWWLISRPTLWIAVITMISSHLLFSYPAIAASISEPVIQPTGKPYVHKSHVQQNETSLQVDSPKKHNSQSHLPSRSDDDTAVTNSSQKNNVQMNEKADKPEIKTLPELIGKETLPETVNKAAD